jgi:hypothetical protein
MFLISLEIEFDVFYFLTDNSSLKMYLKRLVVSYLLVGLVCSYALDLS